MASPERVALAAPAPAVPASTLKNVNEAQKRAESEAILTALDRTRWNRKEAAVLLRVDYKALLYKMKKLGIDGKSSDALPAN